MPGIGVIVNVLSVAIGAIFGTLAGERIPERMREGVVKSAGMAVLVIGISGALSAMKTLGAHGGILGQYGVLVFVGSLVVGTFLGELMRLEHWLEQFGHFLHGVVEKVPFLASGGPDPDNEEHSERNLVEGFMSASLIYCVGAMTVLGSIQDGLGNPSTLYLKALLDGVVSIFLASSLGIGVALSAISVLILQGGIALVAFLAGDIIPAIAVTGVEVVGGTLIAGIGLNFIIEKRIPIGNMLPGVFVAMAACWMLG